MSITHRFHTIEADGPWTSPPFPPAERRHVVQGVIGGFIMGRPRWATDLDGNFIYGLDAKGKEMKSAPAVRTGPSRQHATKKSPSQLDREIAEALAHGPETDPGPNREKWRIEPSQVRVGQRFDYFGHVYEITKIGRDKERTIQVARRVRDPFNKELWIDQRSFPLRALYRQHLVPIGD